MRFDIPTKLNMDDATRCRSVCMCVKLYLIRYKFTVVIAKYVWGLLFSKHTVVCCIQPVIYSCIRCVVTTFNKNNDDDNDDDDDVR